LAGLRLLDLPGCHLSNAGAAALARSPHWGRLEYLGLAHNTIGPAGVEALVSGPGLPRLEGLNLAFNPVGVGGAEALAAARPVPFRGLQLACCRLWSF